MSRTTVGILAAAGMSVALLLSSCAGGPAPAASAPGPVDAPPVTAVPAVTPAPAGSPPSPVATPRSTPAGTGGAGSGGTPCATARLTAALGAAEGTAGSVHRSVRLTNTGGTACVLRGFPGVSYVAGDDGHQVGPAAAWVGSRGAVVELEPGETASAALTLVDVGVFDAAACHPVDVRGLRIYPPGSVTALFVSTAGRGCSADPGRAQLSVTGLRPS